jgi:hypothetical protein
MNISPEVTARSITLVGGLVATGAAVVAQSVASDNTLGTGSFLLGGAGLIAAISAFTKDFWTDRQKQRDHELAKLRIQRHACHTCHSLNRLYAWARMARLAVPGLPPVPEEQIDDGIETNGVRRDD